MHCRRTGIFAFAALSLTMAAVTAHSQGIRLGNRLIPRSGIEHTRDIGVRAHTHVQILIGPPGGREGYFGGLGPGGGLTPAQVRQAYNLPSSGGSQIIAIVDAYDDPNALADFNAFSTQFGLPAEPSTNATAPTNKLFQVVYQNGSRPAADSTGGWELEEALDIEWAHAMAPNAKIVLVEAASANFSDLLSAVATASSYTDGNGWRVKEVSNSWGGSEFNGESNYDSYFSGTGAAYFVAAGDSGAGAEYPSASPYVISAGGTTLATNSSGAFVSESGWSGSGGGASSYEARPAYQSSVSSIVGSRRGTPDLAFDADPNTGVCVYDTYTYEGSVYGWIVLGGTSVASPSLAGIANLAASAAGSFPAGSVALLNNIYSSLGSSHFRDIVTGNNGYAAAAGWDFVTGVGTCLGLAGLQSGASSSSVTISSLSPSSATAGGGGFNMTVSGSGFVSGSTVEWNGSPLATTFVSAATLTAAVPAANIASAGSASVTVANPGGAVSNTATFTINSSGNSAPSISYLSPNAVYHGTRGGWLLIVGKNFLASSAVHWQFGAASYSLSVYYVSSTEVYAYVPTSLLYNPGTAYVTVINPAPGGGTSNAAAFTIH